MKTIWTIDHIGMLATALWRILCEELATPVRIETCVATVAKGLDLHPEPVDVPGLKPRRMGRAWSSEAAFHQLAGLGYVFDARTAMEAIARLEARHVLWKRESGTPARLMRHAERPGSRRPGGSNALPVARSRNDGRRAAGG